MHEKGIHDEMKDHPFFEGIEEQNLKFICGCGRNTRFDKGRILFHEGDDARAFYAIRKGRIAVQIHVPGRGPITVMTLEDGDILGWSWLFPPYRWSYDAIAIETTRAVEFDGTCLRTKCDENTDMGYDLMKRFAHIFAKRLASTRLQILDVYGTTPVL